MGECEIVVYPPDWPRVPAERQPCHLCDGRGWMVKTLPSPDHFADRRIRVRCPHLPRALSRSGDS